MEVRTIVLEDMDRANPKSHNLITPCAPISTFCGQVMAQTLITIEALIHIDEDKPLPGVSYLDV